MPQAVKRLSNAERYERMSAIRKTNTKPELRVRHLLHGLGYRYRVNVGKLPGCPDLVFASRKKIIFVHGCFWHQHKGCKLTRIPKRNQNYWVPKLERTKTRDRKNQEVLEELGWSCLTIWECESNSVDALVPRLKRFLDET